jgi:hypothetical protein
MPINDDCYTTYSELQTKHKLRWIVYGIDGGSIKVYSFGDALKKGREAWADFTAPENMPDGECRYGVFDLDIQMDDGVHERANAKVGAEARLLAARIDWLQSQGAACRAELYGRQLACATLAPMDAHPFCRLVRTLPARALAMGFAACVPCVAVRCARRLCLSTGPTTMLGFGSRWCTLRARTRSAKGSPGWRSIIRCVRGRLERSTRARRLKACATPTIAPALHLLTAAPACVPTLRCARSRRSQAAERDELKYNNMLEMKATELKIPKISLEKMLA